MGIQEIGIDGEKKAREVIKKNGFNLNFMLGYGISLGDLPRIELFAREKVEGWDSWGNEVEQNT